MDVNATWTGPGSTVGSCTPGVVTSHSIFVSPYLFVQLVNKTIDRSVHVTINFVGKQCFAGSVDGTFSLLLVVFDFENYIDRNHVI